MRVLQVDVPGLLGHRLREALGRQHEVVGLDGHPRDLDPATRGTSAIDAVNCALTDFRPADRDPLQALDRASRGVYNLIKTAAAGGAQRFVLLSSLRPFERYPLDHVVTEFWAPRPTTDPEDLIAVVAEAVARVFHIVADLPHGKYRNDRTKETLHWQPRDSLDIHWRRQ